MSHISKDSSSPFENRIRATYHPLFSNKSFNFEYGKHFDNYFNDRFFLRDDLIKYYKTGLSKINHFVSNNVVVFNTKNFWFFKQYELKQPKINNRKDILSALRHLDDFTKKNNIKFYLLIVPSKIDFYREYNGLYNKLPPAQNGDIIKFLKENTSFPIIFPHKALKESSKKDFIFFKTDHHWTEWGAYTGYQELMKVIKKDFSDVSIISENDFDIFYSKEVRNNPDAKFFRGWSLWLSLIGFDDKFLDTPYKYYKPRKPIEKKIINKKKYNTKEFYNEQSNNNYRVVLTGTSMNENLLTFLPYSFKNLKYFRLNSVQDVLSKDEFKFLARYDKDIQNYKPDILILCITAENLTRLSNLTRK